MRRFRNKIIEKVPSVVSSEELAFGLLSTGRVVDVRSMG
jgi:hypothetical protein